LAAAIYCAHGPARKKRVGAAIAVMRAAEAQGILGAWRHILIACATSSMP
jgi:hypothetical protein